MSRAGLKNSLSSRGYDHQTCGLYLVPICLSREAGGGGEEKVCFKQTWCLAHNLLFLGMGKEASLDFQPSAFSAFCFLPSLVRRILPRSAGLQKLLLPVPQRSHHQPLLSMANLQLVWGYMATEEDWRGWGRVGWLQQGLPGRETLRSHGSCRSQTARKATKAKGRQGGMGWPLNNQRVLTFKCSYQHLALLSSLLFLPSFYVYGAWMVLDFLYCFPVGMRLWMLYNFLFCTSPHTTDVYLNTWNPSVTWVCL